MNTLSVKWQTRSWLFIYLLADWQIVDQLVFLSSRAFFTCFYSFTSIFSPQIPSQHTVRCHFINKCVWLNSIPYCNVVMNDPFDRLEIVYFYVYLVQYSCTRKVYGFCASTGLLNSFRHLHLIFQWGREREKENKKREHSMTSWNYISFVWSFVRVQFVYMYKILGKMIHIMYAGIANISCI